MATAQAKPRQAGKAPRRRFFNLTGGPDMPFFVLLMIILVIGLATLYSASHVYAFTYNNGDSYFYIRKQLLWAAMGLAGMLAVSMVDYHVLHRFAWPIWLGSLCCWWLRISCPPKAASIAGSVYRGLDSSSPRSWPSLRWCCCLPTWSPSTISV